MTTVVMLHGAFCGGWTFERFRTPFEALVARMVVESGRALRETLNWWLDPFMTTSVGPGPLGVPALAIAGQRDVGHPPGTVEQTARRIGATLEVMPGMSHWLPGELGW